MWRCVLCGLVAVLLFLPVSAGAITLTDIPPLIRSQNDEVLAARKDSEAAEEGIGIARARFFPQVASRTYFVHLGSATTINVPTQNFPLGNLATISVDLPPVSLDKQDILLSSLILKMPLFAGGRIVSAYQGAKAQAEEAKSSHHKAIEDKTNEALQRYFSYQLAEGALNILSEMKGNLARIRGISESLVRTGLGAKFSTLQIKVAEADLSSRISEAQGKMTLADLAFKTSIGSESNKVVAYESGLKKLPMPAKVDPFKLQALDKRSEMAILKSKSEQVDALKAVRTGQMLPQLSALGAYRVGSNLGNSVETPNWAVGLVLEIPLTGFISSIPEREQAVRLAEKVEILTAKARQEIPLQIEKIFSEVAASDAAYTANQEALDMAKEALRLAEVRLKNGDGSAVEILRATTDLEKAEIRKLQLTEEYNRHLIELYWAGGNINGYLDAYRAG